MPVITTLQTPWKIINGYNAGYVFNFSEENILNYLNKIINLDPEEHYKMGLNAIKLIKDNYDSNIILNQYIDLYKGLHHESFISS